MEIQLNRAVDGAGTHAFVIGVSHYPYVYGPQQTAKGRGYGLVDLTTASRSAAEFVLWLIHEYRNPAAPLASVHLLLSPSSGEMLPDALLEYLPEDCPATSTAALRDLIAFRTRCDARPGDRAIVYIAGHGVQLNNQGAIVLLEDFAAPNQARELDGAIDVVACHEAFNATGFPEHQAWFVDACRQRPSVANKFELLTAGVSLDIPIARSVQSSPLFISSSALESAFAEPGGTTLFSASLLAGLRGAATVGPKLPDVPDWHVSIRSLEEMVNEDVRRKADAEGEEQRIDLTGRANDAIVHRFKDPPSVRLRLDLDPPIAATSCSVSLFFHGADPPVIDNATDWPVERTVSPGLYTVSVDAQGDYKAIDRMPIHVRPLDHNEPLSVSR